MCVFTPSITSHQQVYLNCRLHLKLDKLGLAQEEFAKGIDMTRTTVGPNAHTLVPMLRGRATVRDNANRDPSFILPLFVFHCRLRLA